MYSAVQDDPLHEREFFLFYERFSSLSKKKKNAIHRFHRLPPDDRCKREFMENPYPTRLGCVHARAGQTYRGSTAVRTAVDRRIGERHWRRERRPLRISVFSAYARAPVDEHTSSNNAREMTGGTYTRAHTHTHSDTQPRARAPLSDGRTDNTQLAQYTTRVPVYTRADTHADTRRHTRRTRPWTAGASAPCSQRRRSEGNRFSGREWETRRKNVRRRRRSGNERRTAEYNIFIK